MPTAAVRLARRTGMAASAVALLTTGPARPAAAQATRTLTACTPDALAVCAELRLITGPSRFEIGLRTVGSAAAAPLSVYNLVLGTGAAAVSPRSTGVTPQAVGGATVSDATPWDLFDSGGALFLSASTNRGVGGCEAGGDVGGFGQAANTCGAGQFITFGFTPTTAFDVSLFRIFDLEAVALTNPTRGASCGGAGRECVITADVTTVPEPTTVVLLGAGVAGLAALTTRRRGV